MFSVLIIDENLDVCSSVRSALSREGLMVKCEPNGDRGVDLAIAGDYELVILDVDLTSMPSFSWLQRIRAKSDVPVIVCSAGSDAMDRVIGLEMGADDYLSKPFNTRELTSRVKALHRRAKRAMSGIGNTRRLVVADVELSRTAHTVHRGEELLDLTGAEFLVLELLLQNAGEVVPRGRLVEWALGRPLSGTDRSLDVHVCSLRRKLGPSQNGRRRIKTIRSVGYHYAAE